MTTERRPIRARQLGWVIALAGWLARRRMSPNRISVLGGVACVGAGVCLWLTSRTGEGGRGLWLAAAALCQLRLMCNMMDGMVAIERNVASPVGELYNEVPDRISDIATFVGLGYAAHGNPVLGWACAVLAVMTAYVRCAAKAAGAPQNYCGPMAKQHRMFVCTVLGVFMGIAPASWQAPFGEAWSVPVLAMWVIAIGSTLTILRRLMLAAGALRGKALA